MAASIASTKQKPLVVCFATVCMASVRFSTSLCQVLCRFPPNFSTSMSTVRAELNMFDWKSIIFSHKIDKITQDLSLNTNVEEKVCKEKNLYNGCLAEFETSITRYHEACCNPRDKNFEMQRRILCGHLILEDKKY